MKKLFFLLLFLPIMAWGQFNPSQPYATVNNACGWNGYLQNGTYYSNAGAAMAGGLPSCTQPLTGFPNGIAVGTVLSYTDTGILGTAVGSTNGYLQFILQNLSAGATASSDFIVNNNQSTATTYYGDFGMNSSGFTGSGAFNAANAVYLTSTSSDLAIGTTTSNAIHFVVNGGATDAMTISSSGGVTIANCISGCGGTTRQYAVFQEQYASGTAGATLSSSAFNTRALNTTVVNTITGATLSSNEVSLPAGTYHVVAHAITSAGGNQCSIYDFTHSTFLVTGISLPGPHTGSGFFIGNVDSICDGYFTLSSTSLVGVNDYVGASVQGGVAISSGQPEVYTQLLISAP